MASVRDIIVISILLFVVGLSILFVVRLGHRVNSNILLVPTLANDPNAVSVIEHSDAALNMSDYIYLALFLAFFFSLIITAWIFGGVPIFAPIYFFILIIFIFVSIILQMVYVDIASNSEVFNATLSLPITNFILLHLGYFMTIFGLVAIVVMFARGSNNA